MTVYADKPRVDSGTGVALRLYENMVWSLPGEARSKHTQSVYLAIMRLDDGVVTEWFDEKTQTQGQVRVLATWPKGGGYCRQFESQIRYRYRTRNLTEIACTNDFAKTWTFHSGR